MRAFSKWTAFAAVLISAYWLVLNIIYAGWYIWAFDPMGLASGAPYISRVDISAANTIIFFLTAWFVFRGISRFDAIRKGKMPVEKVWTQSFPFPPGFASLLIQLGLLGTIFAFIIAFNRLAGSGSQNQLAQGQAILIVPLGAALWSSFAGVGFAFVVVPPIQKIFAHVMGVKPQREDSAHQVANLSDTLSKFGLVLCGATVSLEQMQERTRGINDLLANISGSDLRQTLSTIAQNSTVLAQTLPQLVQSQIRLSTDLAALVLAAEEQRREWQATRTHLATIQQALAQQAANADEGRRAAASIGERLADNCAASLELARRLEGSDRSISQLTSSIAELKTVVRDLEPLIREALGHIAVATPNQSRLRINLTKMLSSLLGNRNHNGR